MAVHALLPEATLSHRCVQPALDLLLAPSVVELVKLDAGEGENVLLLDVVLLLRPPVDRCREQVPSFLGHPMIAFVILSVCPVFSRVRPIIHVATTPDQPYQNSDGRLIGSALKM